MQRITIWARLFCNLWSIKTDTPLQMRIYFWRKEYGLMNFRCDSILNAWLSNFLHSLWRVGSDLIETFGILSPFWYSEIYSTMVMTSLADTHVAISALVTIVFHPEIAVPAMRPDPVPATADIFSVWVTAVFVLELCSDILTCWLSNALGRQLGLSSHISSLLDLCKLPRILKTISLLVR